MNHRFDPTVLREYDVRGVVGKSLHAADAYALGRSFAVVVRRAGGRKVAVGADGRLSSPTLEAALVDGLTAGGVDAVRIGLGPTPMLYFAEAAGADIDGGVQVTGSHNPVDHNGFKLTLGRRPFYGEDIQSLGRIAATGDWDAPAARGSVEDRDVADSYVDRLLRGLDGVDPAALARVRMGWDAGNGAAGPIVEKLTARLPGEHHLLYTAVDGTFPHHHPDPTIPANLADLQALTARQGLDFGVAFDGDGDRLGVIDGAGRPIDGDRLLAIFAEDVLAQAPGATVLADVKSSRAVFDRIAALGGRALMAPSGHSLMKARMRETGAALGGELSGHVFFEHGYYGFDDALYAAVRLIAATARLGQSVTALRAATPERVHTPELRFPVAESRKFAVIAEVAERLSAEHATFTAIDGVRVDRADGWWLLRASNTEALLVARAESDSDAGLARLLAEVDAQLATSGAGRGEAAPSANPHPRSLP